MGRRLLLLPAAAVAKGVAVDEALLVQLPGSWIWAEAPGAGTWSDEPISTADGASLLMLSSMHSGAAGKVNSTGTERKLKANLSPRSWFALTFSFAFIVKALCMFSNVLFQVSPLPQVRQFSKSRDTGEVDAAPFISILYGGCQWCFYGLFAFIVTKKSGFLVLVYSNVLGAFLGFYYVLGFQQNCRSGRALQKLFLYYKCAGTLALLQLVAMLLLAKQRALFLSGLVSSVCSVVGACSLLATLPTVLQTRCSASINLPVLIVGTLSGILWLVCGFILWDAWIMVPNTIGLIVQFVTYCVVLYFPRDPARAAALTAPALPAPAASAQVTGYGTVRVVGETGGTF